MVEKRIEILLVEDSPSDVRLTQEALKDTDLTYELTVVNDGEQGVDYLMKSKAGTTKKPDLILLDLNMPKKNGHEVLAEIKQVPELASIPVVLLTVSQDEEEIQKALKLKMNYYLSKPITSDKLSVLLKAMHELWSADGTAKYEGAGSGEDAHVRYVMAGNPHTSAAILERLSAESATNIRARVAENPNTPINVLRTLAKDSSADVRLGVAENPSTPPAVLEELAKDPDDDVRLGLAGNPRIPVHILQKLSADENLYVVDCANKTLSGLPSEHR